MCRINTNPLVARVRHIDKSIGIQRQVARPPKPQHGQRIRPQAIEPRLAPGAQTLALRPQHLNAVVPGIRHVELAVRAEAQSARPLQQRALPRRSKCSEELSLLREERNAVVALLADGEPAIPAPGQADRTQQLSGLAADASDDSVRRQCLPILVAQVGSQVGQGIDQLPIADAKIPDTCRGVLAQEKVHAVRDRPLLEREAAPLLTAERTVIA